MMIVIDLAYMAAAQLFSNILFFFFRSEPVDFKRTVVSINALF